MKNYTLFSGDTSTLPAIQEEVANYLSNFLGTETDEEMIDAVRSNNVGMILYKGIPSYAISYVAPNLKNLQDQLSSRYGEIVDSSIWVATPMASIPVAAAVDRKISLLIPIKGCDRLKIQWYDYDGPKTDKIATNNGVDIIDYCVPESIELLVKTVSQTSPQMSWIAANKFHDISNWSSNLCIYLSLKFENQELLEQDLLSQ